MNRVLRIASILLIGVSASSVVQAGSVSKPHGATTAESAWTQAKDAYRRGDFRTYIETVSPDVYDECICQLSSILSGAIGYELLEPEEELEKVNRILRRHGVLTTETPAYLADSLGAPGLWGREAIARIRDKPGLYRDVMRFLRKHKVGPELPSILSLQLSDVVVEGEKARGRLSGRPRLRPEATRVEFDRRGDAWFVRLPTICLDDKPPVDVPLR